MKIVNLLTILLVAILLFALNDAAFAKPTSKTTAVGNRRHHPSTTKTTHHPSPTKHHKKNHRNRNRKHRKTRKNRKTTTTQSARKTRTSTRRPPPRVPKTYRPPVTPTPSSEQQDNLPNGYPLDPISTTDLAPSLIPELSNGFPSDSYTSSAVPTNVPSAVVSDPNEINPASTTIGTPGQDTQYPDQLNTKTVAPGTSNGKFSLAIGIAIGGVAALGLAGYAVHRRREASRHDDNSEIPPQVSTRWRHQSFLAKVESIVARLPSDRSSRSSAKSKKSSLSGPTSAPSPFAEHNAIPAASTSQVNYGGRNEPEYMEEVHLR